MSVLFRNLRDGVALNVIRQYGMSISFVDRSGGTHDPVTGAVTGGSEPTPFGGVCVLDSYDISEVDGEEVRRTDIKAVVAAGDLDGEPASQMEATVNGVKYTVINSEPVAPAGEAVIYIIQLRK